MSTRMVAYKTLLKIIEEEAYANLALKEASVQLPKDQIPLLYRLVYNALEHRSYLEYILSHYCKRQKKAIRTILLLASGELLFLSTPPHAVVHESVNLCKAIGKAQNAGLVNAVLRRIDRERDALPPLPSDSVARLTVLYGYPSFLIAEWVRNYGYAHTEEMLQFGHTDLQIRSQYPFTAEDLTEVLKVPYRRGNLDDNCFYLQKSIQIEENELFRSGKIAVQNEGAMMICRALGSVRGKRVLDACAAPGGKSAYLASLAENDLDLCAWEVHPNRVQIMERNFARLHINASILCKDASLYDQTYAMDFDSVLLDVPCSGFGLLDDKPDLRYRKSQSDIETLVTIQEKLLNTCSRYVRPGGQLLYATCTISERENTCQVNAFLRCHTEFHLVEEKQLLPFLDGTDGFYYALMVRDES